MQKLVFSCLLLLYLGKALAVEVGQVMFAPTPKLVTQSIDNLSAITSIVTAGTYAWALDYDQAKVAFFDGKTWQAGSNIPQALTILQIEPAYPVSGKTPEAWALIKTILGPAIAYFDGKSWQSSEYVAKILALNNPENIQPVSIRTSGGAIFLLASTFDDYPNSLTYYSVKKSASSAWTVPQFLVGQYDQYNSDVYDDDNPVLNFLVSKNNFSTVELYRLISNGTARVA